MSKSHYAAPGAYAPVNRMQGYYPPPSEMVSGTPGDTPHHHTDHFRGGVPGLPAISGQQAQLATMMMHNPKRPYRQRRKDPSCDACRERKVKCDATETTSCTECSSRNVRCQFTKDTNRRMSSIKQVQDLERQLLDARQQLERYRATESRSEASSALSQSPVEMTTELPTLGKSPRRMLKARTPSDLGSARAQLSDVGRGLLKPPVTSSKENSREMIPVPMHLLPPRHIAERLIQAYLESIHRHFPVLYWPRFHQEFLAIYAETPPPATSRDSVGLLFAVLACGTLNVDQSISENKGHQYLAQAMSTINSWDDDVTVTQAVVGFLVSIFLFEVNSRSAAWIWLGCVIRIVQDKGYHVQGGQWSVMEGEMRKRIWYSFYVWDRILALELGKPMLIDDDECDTEYPEPLEGEIDGSEDGLGLFQPTLLLAAIHVARLLSPLSKLSRSLCITSQTLHKFEAHLYNCLYLLPRTLHLHSYGPLDPLYLRPIIYFQNTRLMLHRHNMSPSCSAEQRMQAIGQCVYAAQDTAGIIARTMTSTENPGWEERLAFSANSIFCTHLWRCMLALVFRQLYEPFFVLHKAASAVGETRVINGCCGRHLLHFIERLIDRYEQERTADLEQDEEVLVFLSADLQAGTNSWVWGNAETGTLLSRRQKHGKPRHTSQERDQSPEENPSSWDGALSPEEQQNWGGWQRIEQAVQHLRQLQERTHPQPGPQQEMRLALPPLSHTPDSTSTSTSSASASTARPRSTSPTTESNRSRMNIASII